MDAKPTNSELEILNVLWRIGPCSVREVHDELNQTRRSGYTTVLKLMQIMAEKGLVTRNDKNRAHIYAARRGEDETRRSLMDDLVERAFGGSAHQLALHALGSGKASPEELAEIRRLLDKMEEKS
jgi:predicted transcriptional regulator